MVQSVECRVASGLVGGAKTKHCFGSVRGEGRGGPATMPTGVLVRWNAEKGFGFIQPQDNSEDVFCHVSDLQDGEGSVVEGDYVLYTEKWDNRKGKYRAAEVELSAPGELAEISAIRRKKNSGRERSRERGDRSRSRGHRDEERGSKPKPVRSNEPGKEVGTMVRWHSDKGFGFIKPDDGGEDLFAHVTALVEGDASIQEGDKVTYDKEYNERKGKDQATNVRAGGGSGGGDRRDRRDRDRRRSKSRSRHPNVQAIVQDNFQANARSAVTAAAGDGGVAAPLDERWSQRGMMIR
eukprot:s253_g3.t1